MSMTKERYHDRMSSAIAISLIGVPDDLCFAIVAALPMEFEGRLVI